MYHCNVCFYLVGCDSSFIQMVRAMTPPEQFTYQFVESGTLSEASAGSADVIFMNIKGGESAVLNTLLTCQKPDSQVILLADKEQTALLPFEKLPDSFDIWTLPLSGKEISFRLSKWFHAYKMSKDYWLCQNYLDATINGVPHLIWYKDKDGVHKKVNESFCQAVNKTMEQVEGRGHYYIWDIEPDEYAKGEFICMESEFEVMNKKETCIFDETVKIRDEMRQLKTYKSPLFDLDGSVMGTVGVATDITQERIYEQMILNNANTDFLTGLYNRRYIYQFMEQESDNPLTVFYLDLDNFKTVNDRYGHQEGDRALLTTTQILQKCMPDDMIARIGGDEFVVVKVGECSKEEVEQTRLWLQEQLDTTFAKDEHLKNISASIGTSQSGQGALIMDALIGEADRLMYEEKSKKKTSIA
ncbi:MAG: sensor domain-containing diguanylate cyclase [Lachnospiraceae bacterium]|nr:sensor domain-containing diguanylate cyclase [Lachnospiraceae bacterium]